MLHNRVLTVRSVVASLALALVAGAVAFAPATAPASAAAIDAASTLASAKAFTTKPKPVITGTVAMGSVITASAGTWTPSASFTYQWKRNGTAIAGATSRSYKVTPSDVLTTLTVVVRGSRAGYLSASVASTGRVPAGTKYANCAALNRDYPHGVARNGVVADMVSGKPKALGALTFFSTPLYNLNPGRDGDKDGIACEKH